MANKNKNDNGLNTKITILIVIAVIWILCLIFILVKCEVQKKETQITTHPNAITGNGDDWEFTPQNFETEEQGTVSKDESKTVAYFNTHFKDSYYRVLEMVTNTEEGETYQTETIAYSTDGYFYQKTCNTLYEEQDLGSSVIKLLTPTNAYVIYPDSKAYFKSEGDSSIYKNNFVFPDGTYKTGKINIYGLEYFYEEFPVENGISTKYCYNDNGELIYQISTSEKGSITRRYVEYSKDIDPSLFEIPSDYKLQE